ncbi:MAG: hydrogenase iron-sulfur subunit [Deltaproteobacteria bacterium]|nr:hydrogenase iron-sulfur subunit [Deltaproteobacteria bacterium]
MAQEKQTTCKDPRLLVLYCPRCLASPLDDNELVRALEGQGCFLQPLPCSSKVKVSHLMKLLNESADGIEILACRDQECRFLTGSVRAQGRVALARELLSHAGLEHERIGITFLSSLNKGHFADFLQAKIEGLKKLGVNPAKTSY